MAEIISSGRPFFQGGVSTAVGPDPYLDYFVMAAGKDMRCEKEENKKRNSREDG